MELKQFSNIAIKVSSRKKSAATFGELPDCLWARGICYFETRDSIAYFESVF